MQKLLHYPVFRSIKPQHLTPTSTYTSISDSSLSNFIVSNEVIVLINSVHPVVPSLQKLIPFLNREIVISVLKSQAELKKDPRISFRFFICASGERRLLSGVSYNLMVDMLLCGDGNPFDLYWSVLDELRNEKLFISPDAFVVLILGYWRLKRAEQAVETFGRMKDYECRPNLSACNVILNVLVKKGVILLALAVYNMMLKLNYQIQCDTFNILIDGLCKSGMTQDALQLFDEMTERGILPSVITYTVIISGLCKAKRTHDAHKLFSLMKNSGCKPDTASYNALLDGFCKCGQIDEAFSLLKSFRADGYNLGIRGFSCMIDGLLRTKRISDAENWFRNVCDVGLVPDLTLYTIMIRGLCESIRVKDAMSMFRDMIGKGNGLLGEAQHIFSDMENHGCSPSAVTFNALINGLCKADKLDEAHLMLYKMEIGKNPSLFLRLSQSTNPVLDRESLQKMVGSLVDSGLILKAYKLLMQLVDSGVVPNIITYNTLINGMCRTGQVNRALKLFEELQLKGNFPDSITYSTLIEGLQRVGRDGDAYKLFEQMNENGCKPCSSAYKTLMTWSCRRRKTSFAFSLWLKYLSSLSGREGGALKSTEELFQRGDLEMALRRLLEMERKLADFDSSPYSIWLVGLCQANRVEEALKTFSILQEFSVIVSAPGCVNLINALCSRGNLSEAVDVFLYTMEKGYRLMPRVCNSLLQALFDSKNDAILAVELLDKMKHMGYDLSSYLHHRTKSLIHHHYGVRKMVNVLAL
ncbi:hypothetical protein OROGR_028210 [Orobanche gracilis]